MTSKKHFWLVLALAVLLITAGSTLVLVGVGKNGHWPVYGWVPLSSLGLVLCFGGGVALANAVFSAIDLWS